MKRDSSDRNETKGFGTDFQVYFGGIFLFLILILILITVGMFN